MEIREKPIQSNGRGTFRAGIGRSAISRSPAAASANGTTLKKIHVHDRLSSNHP